MPDLTKIQIADLTRAGLISARRYAELCAERGWPADPRLKDVA